MVFAEALLTVTFLTAAFWTTAFLTTAALAATGLAAGAAEAAETGAGEVRASTVAAVLTELTEVLSSRVERVMSVVEVWVEPTVAAALLAVATVTTVEGPAASAEVTHAAADPVATSANINDEAVRTAVLVMCFVVVTH